LPFERYIDVAVLFVNVIDLDVSTVFLQEWTNLGNDLLYILEIERRLFVDWRRRNFGLCGGRIVAVFCGFRALCV
jgi:hypothetical protein